MQESARRPSAVRPLRIGVYDTLDKANRYRRSGILRFASGHPDLHIVLRQEKNLLDDFADNGAGFHREHLDGVIVNNNGFVQHERKPQSIPIACTCFDPNASDKRVADVNINLDNAALARAAADLLLKRGHVNFAYVHTPLPMERPYSQLRAETFADAVRAKGYACAVYAAGKWRRSEYANLQRLADWLINLPKPCAILTYADNVAHIVMDACHFAHLSVPAQISLVGIDNDPEVCDGLQPTLTSLWPDFERSGYLAAEALYNLLRGLPLPSDLTYGVKAIVERASTQDMRGGGRLVARACEILRSRSSEHGFRADALAAELNVSRRLLDRHFREILGHTIHGELERLRLETAKRLLAETSDTVFEISEASGYSTVTAFHNAFAAATGITPGSWRRRSR